MEQYLQHGPGLELTINAASLVGKRVLAHSGYVYGRVHHVRLTNDKLDFAGIIVRRGLLKKPVFMSKSYVEKVTGEAVILSIDPSDMYLARKVVSADGKKYGRVRLIERKHDSNDIAFVHVRRRINLYKIPHNEFSKYGASLILKKTYEEAKKSYTAERRSTD